MQLRHEFVGMMFAVTIGEVGLQTAALVQAGQSWQYLPAWTHLILATAVIATSWVGWSLSQAIIPKQDVRGIFQWQFIVLVLDVCLVIMYFILVRTVDFGKDHGVPRIDPASKVALIVVWIFWVYIVWDVITKVVMYWLNRREHGQNWLRDDALRISPTLVCLLCAYWVLHSARMADVPHWICVDLASFSLFFLFRALKDVVSAAWPKKDSPPRSVSWAIFWSTVCIAGVVLGSLATQRRWSLPLPQAAIADLNAPMRSASELPSGNDSSQR